MDLRKLKKLIDLVEESGIAEIEVTEGEEKVRITRTTAAAAPIYAAPAPAAAAPVAAPAAAPAAAAPAAAPAARDLLQRAKIAYGRYVLPRARPECRRFRRSWSASQSRRYIVYHRSDEVDERNRSRKIRHG